MTTLRGLQLAAIYTGDTSWNKQPEKFRKEIADEVAWADGSISELFPKSGRNEGCSIADWVMLNLYAGFISGEDEAYEKAENALWNALFLNQTVNGGFGHRDYESDHTYGGAVLSMECWFCCLHNAGLAMVEFADHAVTLRGDELRINLLVPGRYKLPYKGTTIEVEVSTRYPEKADTTVVISGAPTELKARIRIPSCIKGAEVKVTNLPGGKTRHVLSGRMGYQLEEVKNGVVLRDGPLVMAPLRDAQNVKVTNKDNDFLQGYIFERIDKGRATIVPPDKDADGFYLFPKEPKPIWKNYEEGTLSRLAFDNLSINVKLAYSDGTSQVQRFWPECYSTTSTLQLHNLHRSMYVSCTDSRTNAMTAGCSQSSRNVKSENSHRPRRRPPPRPRICRKTSRTRTTTRTSKRQFYATLGSTNSGAQCRWCSPNQKHQNESDPRYENYSDPPILPAACAAGRAARRRCAE